MGQFCNHQLRLQSETNLAQKEKEIKEASLLNTTKEELITTSLTKSANSKLSPLDIFSDNINRITIFEKDNNSDKKSSSPLYHPKNPQNTNQKKSHENIQTTIQETDQKLFTQPQVKSQYTTSENIKKIVNLQRFRRSIMSNTFFFFTNEAKIAQKNSKKLETFFTTPFINKMEINHPFKLDGWKKFYNAEKDCRRFKFQNYGTTTKIRKIDDNSVYIGEINLQLERHGYGTLITKKGDLSKGIWINNSLNGWCRTIENGIMTEGI